jgi:hypothetical protein
VLIREKDGTPAASMQALTLAEVRLYQGATYTQVPASQLTFAQSSTANVSGMLRPATNCNDGSTTSLCTTNGPSSGDASPWLRVSYACPAGLSTVTRVDVVNVASPCTNACFQLASFTLDFVNAAGRKDMQSYSLQASSLTTVYAYPAGEDRLLSALYFDIMIGCCLVCGDTDTRVYARCRQLVSRGHLSAGWQCSPPGKHASGMMQRVLSACIYRLCTIFRENRHCVCCYGCK